MLKSTEDEIYCDHEVISRRPMVPFRYFIMLMVLASTTIMSAVRSTMNVAIIAMVVKPTDTNQTIHQELGIERQFDWNQHEQGIILGSYYYTYTAVQIFVGNLADKFNVVRLMTVAQVISTLCSLTIPSASVSIYYLVAIQMLMGLAQGPTYAALYNMIENWFPPTELGFAQGLAAAGGDFGSALAAIYTAWISTQGLWGGWPLSFYTMGISNLIFGLVWMMMVTRDPFSNRFVTDYEKRLLHRIVLNKKVEQPKVRSTPWIKMLTSIPLWTVIITKATIGLAATVISSKIPVYLDSVLGYKLEHNGLINGLLYVGSGSTQLTCGPLSKYIIQRGWISRTKTRKMFESISLSGLACSLIAVCYLGNHTHLIVACLVLSMFFHGINLGGDVPIVAEMAPGLIGTTFGFANTFASATGFIAPSFVAFILGDDAGSQSKWILAFQITAGLQIVSITLFNIFASAEPQSWGKVSEPNDLDNRLILENDKNEETNNNQG